MFYQEMFECITCGLEAVCAVCVRTCHAGHDTKARRQWPPPRTEHTCILSKW